jgi:hypothetical protein
MLVNVNSGSVNVAEDTRTAKLPVSVPVTNTAANALSANPNRACYSIYNAGPATVFMREGAAVTSTLYDVPIPAGFYWKEDFPFARYLGVISVITASGTASLLVSEGSLG